jgi:HK97 family phage portal protein
MSVFNKLFPPRTFDKAETNMIEKLSGWSVFTDGKKTANLFDINDHSVIQNGYNQNPYVYSVVNRLAMLCASIPIKAQKVTNEKGAFKYKSMQYIDRVSPKGLQVKEESFEDVPDHPLQGLIDNPNKQDGYFEFWYNFFINKLVTGNAFVEAIKPTETRPPVELWNLPPLAVSLNETNDFYNKILEVYFSWGQTQKTIPIELILHSKYYNPDGRVWGLSPLSAARRAVKMINDGEDWNVALIQNGAKPEYVIVVPQGTGHEQRERIKKDYMDRYTGPGKAGKEPFVAEADFMKFEQLGYTVKDMDWATSNLTSMRKVYDVYGIGSELGNDPENKIQSNKREAMRSLYTDKILPEVDSRIDELNRWLVPMYGEEKLMLVSDLSGVDALNDEKDKVATRMAQSEWLTMNEKRQEMGFERIDNPVFDEPWLGLGKLPLSEVMMTPEPSDLKALLEEYSINGSH